MFRTANSLLSILLSAGAAYTATRSDLKVGDRTAIVYAPSGYKNPPLVISMHGMGIPAGYNQGMMQFERYADTAKERFITVYPQGVDNRWDLGSNKDIDFILAIVDSMSRRYGIDRNRVYATGFSMGGMMSWYLSCKIPDKIAAIVPGCGYPLGGLSGCSTSRNVPALQIHGTADDFVKYSNLPAFLSTVRTRYGCPSTPVTTRPYPANKPTSKSFKEYWGPCEKNGSRSELGFIHVTGMIHDWATPGKMNANEDPAYKGKPFDIDGTHEAWNWMKNHSLNGATGIAPSPRGPGGPRVVARMVQGGLRLESDAPISEAKIVDLQGNVLASWNADGAASREIRLPGGALARGAYVVELQSESGRGAVGIAIP